VLGAETDAKGQLIVIAVNHEALRATRKPVILVVRINGMTPAWDRQAIALRIGEVASAWQASRLLVSGVEIDYDCPTKGLSAYGEFLTLVKAHIGTGTLLSITALPSWADSPHLAGVLAHVNETVLQVHSVLNWDKGLFDPVQARLWVAKWAERSSTPFRVALPNYWSRVTWNAEGRISAVESEVSRYGPSEKGRELLVMPESVDTFLRSLERRPIPALSGVVWFRLPTSEDRRTWSISTWRAVMQRRVIRSEPPTTELRASESGTMDLYVANKTDIDTRLPREVEVKSAYQCVAADALPPYDLERQSTRLLYTLKDVQMLEAGHERVIGWVRCGNTGVQVHARF
jgi:hypothetical protein